MDLYRDLNQPGRNWNTNELNALKKRHSKLLAREMRHDQRTYLKRNTERFTELSSVGGKTKIETFCYVRRCF